MGSVREAIVKHLRADSTLTTAMGLTTDAEKARIALDRNPEAALPAIAVVLRGSDRIGQALRAVRIEFWIFADGDAASMIETISNRIAALFQDKTHYYLNSAGVNQLVTRSLAIDGADEGAEKSEDNSYWRSIVEYNFTCPTD